MQTRTLARGTAASFVAAGASLALWAALHPWDHLTGAAVGQSGQWIAAHSFHFLSGLALLWAISGLAILRFPTATRFGTASAAIWFLGAALWTGTGMITAYVWPTLAVHAPQVTELNGPVFSPPHPVIMVTALVFSSGMILTGIAMLRAGLASLPVAACLVVGGAVLLVPPHPIGPMPWAGFVAGAVLAGIGTAALSRSIPRILATTPPAADERAAVPRARAAA
jgi:hypothetical protein